MTGLSAPGKRSAQLSVKSKLLLFATGTASPVDFVPKQGAQVKQRTPKPRGTTLMLRKSREVDNTHMVKSYP